MPKGFKWKGEVKGMFKGANRERRDTRKVQRVFKTKSKRNYAFNCAE